MIVAVRSGQATKATCLWTEPRADGSPLTALLAEVPPCTATEQYLPETFNYNVPFPKLGYAIASLTPS